MQFTVPNSAAKGQEKKKHLKLMIFVPVRDEKDVASVYPAGTFRNVFRLMADSGLTALLLWNPYRGWEYPAFARAPIPANGESLVIPEAAKEFLLVEMRRRFC